MVTVFTLGHSVRSQDELIRMCRTAGIARLVDVRRRPYSRRHPHFGKDRLASALQAAGIEYQWAEELGGLREPKADSPHVGWKEPAFTGYADHMETSSFAVAGERLLAWARDKPTAIMCAEKDFESCHRRLLSDWLTVHGAEVRHVLAEGREQAHVITPLARVIGERLVYDGNELFRR
jgi:uncharacterized protein (DUF488 family)